MKEFDNLSHEQRETLLMETSMRFMENFCATMYCQELDLDKVEQYGTIERLQLFSEWAREFENTYYTEDDTAKYRTDYIELSDEFAQQKLVEHFGIE